jgi:predicted RNA-binding protein associated with RNAse of E/G family
LWQTRPIAFGTGSLIVTREDWRGYLHSAIPRLVVLDQGQALVDWSPPGTVGVYASSRHYPGREHLPRNERKMLTLETCRWLYTSVASEMGGLNFVDEEHPSCTTLGWSAEGRFLGWYVNFQRPIVRTEIGYDSMDLVVDLVVAPSYDWHWKDEAEFERAIRRGIVDEGQRRLVEVEAERVLHLIEQREGPFGAEWTTWGPPDDWEVPKLPAGFGTGLGCPAGAGLADDSGIRVH